MLLFAENMRAKGWGASKIINHFWLRGVALILLQFFVINPIWKAGPEFFPEIYIGVLVALGGTMMLGSFFLGLGSLPLLLLTLGLLVGTELLHPNPEMWGQLNIDLPNMLMMRSGGDGFLWSNYPILPWLELVSFGMLFGLWLRADEKKAYNTGFYIGIALLVTFVIIRYLDGFGNIRPRSGDTWIDILNVVKYPPSMTFTFMTMGINLILLWVLSQNGKIIEATRKLWSVYGSEPLFMYVTHLVLYMLIGKWFAPNGSSIPAMLPYWLFGLIILYPLTYWYGMFKQKQPSNSIWRFV